MSADGVTFGQAISKARKGLGLSQKELAARVMKEEGGGSISPQYLNDIEHDRRSPSWDCPEFRVSASIVISKEDP